MHFSKTQYQNGRWEMLKFKRLQFSFRGFFLFLGVPIEQHPAVPIADIRWLSELMGNEREQPKSYHCALLDLRRKLFLLSHTPYQWIQGKYIVLCDYYSLITLA